MSFASQLENSVAYALHQATYNPDAEAYSKEQAEEAASAAAAKQKAVQQAKDEKAAKEAAAKEKAAKEEEEARKTFSASRLFQKILKYGFYAFLLMGLIVIGCKGASYAANTNVYHTWQARIWCAIYGFLFGIPVMLYSWYRSFNGHVDPYFSFLPVFTTEEASETVKRYFDFLVFEETSHKAQINGLKEWESRRI
jgi:cation transport ATPase